MWQTERAQALGLQVMATGELLINVLCQLDQRTLLCSAVRVCHRWNDLIETTPSIQRRHFLSPFPQQTGDTDVSSLSSRLDWDDGGGSSSNDNNRKTPPVRLNPLLSEIFRPFFTPSSRPGRIAFSYVFSRSPDWSNGTRGRPRTAESVVKFARVLRPGASWRRMLTQQPPVRRLGLWVQRQGDASAPAPPVPTTTTTTTVGAAAATAIMGRGSFLVVEYPDGLRMGELYDLCLGPARAPNFSFRPFWSPHTPALGLSCMMRTTRTTSAAHDRELASVLQSAALQLADDDDAGGGGEWRGVDAVLRLFKPNTSWPPSANQTNRFEFMRQFSFPQAEAEAEPEAAADVV